jgi:hypothetical protein
MKKTPKPSMRWTVQRLVDYACELGVAEHNTYRLRGGPLPKTTLLYEIEKREGLKETR